MRFSILYGLIPSLLHFLVKNLANDDTMVSFGFLLTLYALFTPFGHCFSLFKRKDGLKVLSPNSSDRFTTGIDFLIRWEVSDESSVKLEVRKGFPENLTTVHVISRTYEGAR